ncbi:MAG TPA: ABC transporter permease [Vicinamibacterales bacterium]|nr:ABC transporter permease [Vicinamibacterales bacterium]
MARLRFAFRTLFKAPFLTVVAIVSLALGIGANAAIFSLFDELLLRPLPVPAPSELVDLSAPGPKPGSQSCGQPGDCDAVFSYPMFRDLQRVQTVFTNVAAFVPFGANLSANGETLSGRGVLVSGSYFPVLRLPPAAGRLLSSADDQISGQSPVVVLSYGFWERRFGKDPSAVGRTMIVNGQTMTIVGVAPRGFEGTTVGMRPQVYVPITMRETMTPGWKGFSRRTSYWAYLFARLRPGVTIDAARASLGTQYHAIVDDVEAPLQKGMSDATLKRFRSKSIVLAPGSRGQSTVSTEATAPLRLLLSVTMLVLIIACANIANLLLARGAARAGEMAVRLSIGASRSQLIAQLLTESVLLALLGGVAGLVVARWTMNLIAWLLPPDTAATLQFTIDGPVLLFALVLTLATGVLFGLFPALHATRPDLLSTLKGQAGQPSGAKGAARFRTSLATAQIALSMALLVAAGLFTKSLVNVSRVDLGVDIDHVVTFGVSPELNGYSFARSKQFFVRLEHELSGLPGVTRVTASLVPLLAGNNWGNDVAVQGFKSGPDVDSNARFNEVGPGYFHTMGIPVLAGREFTTADADNAPKVTIVNEAFLKKFHLGRDAVGTRMGDHGGSGPMDREIVGIVQDAKYSDVKQQVPPLFFEPYREDDSIGALTFYVRSSLPAEQALAAIGPAVRRLDPNLPIEDLRTLPEQVRDNVFLDRFITVLSTAFAILATLLAAIGLYGVLAYTIAQRTREIGLRMALGAAPGRVRSMVLRQVGRMTLVGGVVGLAGAWLLGRMARALLYEMQGADPVVLVSAAVLLTCVALGAGLVPAHRASRIDPMRALRYE